MTDLADLPQADPGHHHGHGPRATPLSDTVPPRPFATHALEHGQQGLTAGAVMGAEPRSMSPVDEVDRLALEADCTLDALTTFAGIAVAGPIRQRVNPLRDYARFLAAELQVSRQAHNRRRADYDRACETIAQMHAAALGQVRAPIVGVVEDVENLRRLCGAQRAALAEQQAAQPDPGAFEAARREVASLRATIQGWSDNGVVNRSTARHALQRATAAAAEPAGEELVDGPEV